MNPRTAARSIVVCGSAALALQAGCGSKGKATLDGEVGVYGPLEAGPGFEPGGDDAAAGLDAHVEQGHVAVHLVAVTCSHGCADVEAVASGGYPPYTFAWSDGTTSLSAGARRSLCPQSTRDYTVTVTDTGASGEISRPPDVVQTKVTAEVFACPDGGADDGGAPTVCFDPGVDAGRDVPARICGPSPALAGGPGSDGGLAPSCSDFVYGGPEPYARFAYYGGAPSAQESLGVALCQPLRRGQPYAMAVDVAGGSRGDIWMDPIEFELWGGRSDCPADTLLYTSAATQGGWRFCAVFTPGEDIDHLRVVPRFANGTSAYELACVDIAGMGIYPGATACPALP